MRVFAYFLRVQKVGRSGGETPRGFEGAAPGKNSGCTPGRARSRFVYSPLPGRFFSSSLSGRLRYSRGSHWGRGRRCMAPNT